MTFAERLRYYREKAKLSQKDLSDKINIPFQTYNNYETKGIEPKIDIIIKLAMALGIDVNTLVGFQPNNVQDVKRLLESYGFSVIHIDDKEVTCLLRDVKSTVSIDKLLKEFEKAEQEADNLFSEARFKFIQDHLIRFIESNIAVQYGKLFSLLGVSPDWLKWIAANDRNLPAPKTPLFLNDSAVVSELNITSETTFEEIHKRIEKKISELDAATSTPDDSNDHQTIQPPADPNNK